MLMGLAEPLEPGRMLEVTLEFASGHSITVPAHVKGRPTSPSATVSVHMVTGIRMTEAIRTAAAARERRQILENSGVETGCHAHGKFFDLHG